MNYLRLLMLCVAFTICTLLPQPLVANEQGFGVPKVIAYPAVRGVSRVGKVTGDGCRSDNDCIVGCVSGQPDDLKCLTQGEASNDCVSPDAAPKADYPCVCLSDVSHCGFQFAKEKEPEQALPPAQPKPKAKTVKKPSQKKAIRKTTHKKKATKAKPAAPFVVPSTAPTPIAPTPITKEPAHDSGQ